MHLRTFSILTLLALFALGGCDLLGSEPDTSGTITGRVVLAETGEPLSGLGVALGQRTNGPGLVPVASVRTDGDGAFRIDYDTEGDRDGLALRINAEPYDSQYATNGANFEPGEDLTLGTVELSFRED